MEKIVNITESAEEYLAKLLQDKNEPNLAVRIFISDPGTPKAETCLAYCKPEEADKDDVVLKLDKITVHVEKRSIPFLVDAEVNYDNDTFGGQLTIKAPNARLPNISPDSPPEDRINYVIYNEINPMLESHGGEVSLVKFTDQGEAILHKRAAGPDAVVQGTMAGPNRPIQSTEKNLAEGSNRCFYVNTIDIPPPAFRLLRSKKSQKRVF